MRRRFVALVTLVGFGALSFVMLKLAFWLSDLRNQRHGVVIASKAFTESWVLAELYAQAIERWTDLPVERRFHLGGTLICFHALQNGGVDLYPEYSGTAWLAILKRAPLNDDRAMWTELKRSFRQRYDLEWLSPQPFNSTWALALDQGKATKLGIAQISDLKAHPELRLGLVPEFLARRDGYPGLRSRYGLGFLNAPKSLDPGLMFRSLKAGAVDVVSVNATDARVGRFGLRLLKDDRAFFPTYQIAPLVRRAILEEHPEIRAALARLDGAIDDDTMRALNAEVDVRGAPVARVVSRFLDRCCKAAPRP